MYFAIKTTEDGIRIYKIKNINDFLNECIEENQIFSNDFPEDKWNKIK